MTVAHIVVTTLSNISTQETEMVVSHGSYCSKESNINNLPAAF